MITYLIGGIVIGILLSLIAVIVGKKSELKLNQPTKQFGQMKPQIIMPDINKVGKQAQIIKPDVDLKDILG